MSAGIGSKLDWRKAFTSARNEFVPAGRAANRKADSRLFKKFSSEGFIHRRVEAPPQAIHQIGLRSTSWAEMIRRCNSLVPSPMHSSGASR